MNSRTPHSLDGEIDASLRKEPLRPVPPGLYRRTRNRLLVIAALDRERRRFRYASVTVGGILTGVVAVGMVYAIVSELPKVIMASVPGFLGYADYMAATLTRSFSSATALLALLATVAVGATMVLALASIPACRVPWAFPRISRHPSRKPPQA